MVSSRIFRSRWAALLWAGGILWTAVDVATATRGAAPDPAGNASSAAMGVDATGEVVTNADLAALAGAMNAK